MNNRESKLFFSLSPIIILIVTQATAIILGKYLHTFVYIPIILIYWVILILIIIKYGTSHIRKWLSKPQGHWFWFILAAVIGLSSLPLFIQYSSLLNEASVLIPTIIFFIINPWIEEFYWRGILIDVTEKWPPWVSLLYSSILFTMWHSAFAWYSVLSRGIIFFISVMILAVIMGLIYQKTKSLWLCIISHTMINFLNLSIPSLLNKIEI